MEIANGSTFILNVCVFCFRVPRKERCAISPSLMRLLVDFPQINGESVPNAQCSLTMYYYPYVNAKHQQTVPNQHVNSQILC